MFVLHGTIVPSYSYSVHCAEAHYVTQFSNWLLANGQNLWLRPIMVEQTMTEIEGVYLAVRADISFKSSDAIGFIEFQLIYIV